MASVAPDALDPVDALVSAAAAESMETHVKVMCEGVQVVADPGEERQKRRRSRERRRRKREEAAAAAAAAAAANAAAFLRSFAPVVGARRERSPTPEPDPELDGEPLSDEELMG